MIVLEKYAKKQVKEEKYEKVINPEEEYYIDSSERQYITSKHFVILESRILHQIPSLLLNPILLLVNIEDCNIEKIQGLDHLKELKMLSLSKLLVISRKKQDQKD